MDCREFLEHYSDYRDASIADEALRLRLGAHVRGCLRCMCYDALVCRGVMALRAMSDLEPSPAFGRRLRRRLERTAAIPPRRRAAPTAAVVTLLAAAAAALLFAAAGPWSDLRGPTADGARRALPVVVANPGVPFVTFLDLRVPAFQPGGDAGGHPLGTRAALLR